MVKKKQHYVPQCYLRNFTNSNSLFVLDKIEKSIYSSNVKNIAQSNYFYDFPTPFLKKEFKEKEKNQIIENNLSEVESNFGKFLKQIIGCLEEIEKEDRFDSIGVLDEEAKINLSAFLTLQLVRTYSLRQQTKGLFQALDDLKRKADQALINCKNFQENGFPAIRDSTRSANFSNFIKIGIEEDSTAQHLLLVSDVLDKESNSEIAKILSNHIWLFGVNSTSISLWTSDNPIVIKPYKEFGKGLNSFGARIIYPISSKHVLIMFEPNFWSNLKRLDRMSIILSEDEVSLYNKLQAQQCYRQIYSRANA